MATATGSPSRRKLKKQPSQSSITTQESVQVLDTDVDTIMNKKWQYNEVEDLIQLQLATLPGGRAKNGGAIIIMEGGEGLEYSCNKVGKILSYIGKIPEEQVQSKGFTVILDMRVANWSQAKKALESLKLTFIEHIHEVIVMRPKSFWQRGKSSMSFSFNKSKYGFKCILLEHSSDLFQYVSIAQVPSSQGGHFEYNHKQWMEIQKTAEMYFLQLIAKNENYIILQGTLQQKPQISSLNDARDAVKYHVNMREQLDRSALITLSETVSHSISRLRPLTSNPDFEHVFVKLEDIAQQLHNLLGDLEVLWKGKGEMLDRVLQFKMFETDASKHIAWLHDQYKEICRNKIDVGESMEDAEENKIDLEEFRSHVNSQHQDINRTIEMGERLVTINHPDTEMIQLRCNEISEKWEQLNEAVEERMAMMFLAVNFFTKQDKFLLSSEVWIDQCGLRTKPLEVNECETILDAHKSLKDIFTNLYTQAKQDGHSLIDKLRKPIGNQGVPRNFTLATRFIKECLETLYDEKTLVDDQWLARHDHLKKTLSFRLFQRDTQKIFKWISEVGNQFLLTNTLIGYDVDSAMKLLKTHDTFESSSEVPVVYSQSNLLQTRSLELISGNDCRKEEVKEEASTLDESINTFATLLDERREILVLSVECFKACKNFVDELESLQRPIPQEKFEGSYEELEGCLNRFKTHRDIIRKISTSTFKLWSSLLERLSSTHRLGNNKSDSVINYTSTIQTMKEKIKMMEETEHTCNGLCHQRENHWELSTERYTLVTKMTKHLVQLDSWLQEQSLDKELSDNLLDAEIQRDIFKRQYDQQKEETDQLIERGWEINEHLSKLDVMMFGEGVITGATMKEQVEVMIVKVEKGKNNMMKRADPHLSQLNDCAQYYRLEHDSKRLSDSLKLLSVSLISLVDISQTLEDNKLIHKSVQDMNQQFKGLSEEIKLFNGTIKQCETAGHYQSSSLSIFSRTVTEKSNSITKLLKDKKIIVKGALDFHNNYNKLKSTLEHCMTQFSSRDMGTSHNQIETQQTTMKEMRLHLEEAVEVVKSHADQLATVLGKSQPLDSRKGSSEDVRTPVEGAPRLLVSPRKVRQGKSLSPGPSAITGQQILDNLIKEMESKVSRAIRIWEVRHTRLEQSKHVLLFEEQVPIVLKWLDKEGKEFIKSHCDYGKSIEEVKGLIEEFQSYNDSKVKPVTEQVERLQTMMKEFEEMGHHELNRIRSLGNHLEQRWEKFEMESNNYGTNLKLSLELQEKLFDGSNWCMQSEQFLQSLDDKVNRCETSEEVGSLSAELSVYLLVTQGEQLDRVSKIKDISTIIHSNPLVELSQHLTTSTRQIIRDFENIKQELQTLHSKLVQIEEEKDREMRMIKQKERVIEELITTELSYVSDLKLVVDTCKPRFISDFLPDSLRGKETIVFGNIQWIAEFHVETLLPSLLATEKDIDLIAQVFIDNVDILTDLYVPYCKNKTDSEELLASHRSYLSRVQSLFGTDNPLSSLLIKPIQRITKYPLLLKDALRYQNKLNLPIDKLEIAILAVEEIPVQTNNAINLSLLQSEEGLNWHKYGELLHQGSLMVSEPRLLITSEKERQVFVFENTVAFARKIELGQAKFKYEYKFRIPITAGVQILEFLEGEPCKFAIFTSDHRMHFRAPNMVAKQRWVKSLRIGIHKHVEEEELTRVRSMTESNRKRSNTMLTSDKAAVDLRERKRSPLPVNIPRGRPSSPFSKSRVNVAIIPDRIGSPVAAFDIYRVTADHEPFDDDHHGIPLKKDDKIEVMEELEGGRCFVRSTTITGQIEHGWVPSTILEGPLPPEILFSDEDDHLPSEEIDQGLPDIGNRRNTSIAANGNKDIASQQVISTLRKVTLGDELQPSPKSSPRSSPRLTKKQLTEGRMSPLIDQRTAAKSDKHSPSPQPSSPNSINKPKSTDNQRPISPVRIRLERKGVVRRQSRALSGDQQSTVDNMDPPIEENIVIEQESCEENELEKEKKKAEAEQKLKYIMAELIETEQEYVIKLDKLVNGYLKEIQNSTELPETLVGKEKMIFGNIEAIYDFHKDTFKDLLVKNKDSLENIAACFLDKRAEFSVYVSYCENKPKSESFIWTFTHQGGTFFKDIQVKLGLREDIASFLIKPVQRITKYQLLLKDLFKTSQKIGLDIPVLEESVQLMKEVPKQANDAMALSMIIDYLGNIHANGQIIKQDEFTVFEKSRWTGGAKRHVFLLDRVMIITKEKDNDGLYVFKDSLKVYNMFHSENNDSPSRFTIGTGPVTNPDKFYILEASSPEKKQEWTRIIKDLLKQQFDMLKALKQPNRTRSSTVEITTGLLVKQGSISEYIDDISDSDLDDDSNDEQQPSPAIARKRSKVLTAEDDSRKYLPFTMNKSPSASPKFSGNRVSKLYIAGDDCPPATEGQKILYIRKGQIYDILSQSGDWWLGRLIRDASGGDTSRGTEGWIPSTFMDLFQGQLSYEEEIFSKWGDSKLNNSKYSTLPIRLKESSPSSNSNHNRLSMFPLLGKMEERKKKDPSKTPKGLRKNKSQSPRINTPLLDETVIKGQDVQFTCVLTENYSGLSVDWEVNGKPLTRQKAFISSGKSCILKIQEACSFDEGVYTCRLTLPNGGIAISSAKLTVLGPPCSPGKPSVQQITSTSVSLSWTQPTCDGHSPITVYLVECRDAQGSKWSTIMKRITDPATIVTDLVPGTEYLFRVLASNAIGSSEPSGESQPFFLVRQTSGQIAAFTLDLFDNHYTLVNELARGQFSIVYECLHEATQQSYVAKLIPLSIGRDHAFNELSILSRINHSNIVQLTAAYLTDKHYIIVLHYAHGVPIFEYFICRLAKASSVIVMQCLFSVVSALAYLHELKIAHLSIKPTNIIIREKINGALTVKLVHLSHSRDVTSDKIIASPSEVHIEYNAPELLLKEPVTTATDMWSVGVLIYTLLAGAPPFVVDSVDLTKENIREVRVNVFSRILKGIADEPKKLIQQLLRKDQSNRPTANECLRESWLQTGSISSKNSTTILDMNRLKYHVERTSV